MPALSRWMIRSALFDLWIGFGLAGLILSHKGKPDLFPEAVGGWTLAHIDLLLIGWMVQLSMGVAYWITPRLPYTLTERGRYPFAFAAALLINSGVWLYVAGIIMAQHGTLFEWMQFGGLAAQAASIIAFAIHLAPRVRPTFVAES